MENLDPCHGATSDISEQGRDLFSHYGVAFKSPANKEDDSSCNGTLSIIQYSFGKCIEWKPADVSEVSECQDQEWAMVNTVGRKARSLSGSIDGGLWRYQGVRLAVKDLKGYRVSQRKTKLILIQNDGTSYNAFFFHFGNADGFTKALRNIVKTRRSRLDKHFFLVIPDKQDQQSLMHSFSELNLFSENPKDAVWKFVNYPYETTLSTFSKFSELLLESTSSVYKNPGERPSEEMAAELLSESRLDGGEEGYQVVGLRGEPPPSPSLLPPRHPCPRGPPLTLHQWTNAMDADGRIINPTEVKEIIFRGGVNPSIRYEVWKFLLGYFPWESTRQERNDLRKDMTETYFTMKLQWKSISTDQEHRFSDFRERKSLIEKDVNRTDRTVSFFSGENNPNLVLLSDILMTYVMYNFDLGYVQGMSDLLSPILTLMNHEVDAFWCFVGFMDKVYRNFDMDQSGMKKQLSQLQTLVSAAMPDLAAHLDQHDSGNMFFCFRWLLVWFKREFSQTDIMSLWEILWTGLPCTNFHLLVCVAILDIEKSVIINSNYGFTEVLKHVNELSCKMDVDKLLSEAESIYKQLAEASNKLTMSTKRVLGLAPPMSSPTTTASSDEETTATPQTDHESSTRPSESSPSNEYEIGFERAISSNFL